jgi:hypothetical protein
MSGIAPERSCNTAGQRVEVMGSYSNPSVVSRLQRLLAGQDTDRVSDRSTSIVSRKRKQAQVRLGPDGVAELVRAYQAGNTLEEVAAKFGVYVRTAAAHLDAKASLSGVTASLPNRSPKRCSSTKPDGQRSKSATTSVSTRRACGIG